MKTKLFLTGIALVAFIGIASAQQKPVQQKTQTNQGTFVDANNDGVCDNYTAGGQSKGQGLNQKNKANAGQGKGLKKGNGTCNGSGKGKGQGQGQGKGQGKGGNFVDANNNGTCDNRE